MDDPRGGAPPGPDEQLRLQLHPDATKEWRPPGPVRAAPSLVKRARASPPKRMPVHLLQTGDAQPAPRVDKHCMGDGGLRLGDGSAELVEFVCMAKHVADPSRGGYTLAQRS